MTSTVTTTSLPVVTPPVVRAYVRHLRKDAAGRSRPRSRVVGIRAQPTWLGPEVLEVDGGRVHVRACVSALAIREALLEHEDHVDDYLVVITDVDDLDHGLAAHLAYGRLQPVQWWQTVKESFDARDLDPGLTADKTWAAALALVQYEPAGGWPAAPAGTLTRDFALGQLASVLLGRDADGEPYLDAEHPDVTGLLRWSGDSVAVRRWHDLPAQVRHGVSRWLAERLEAAGKWTLAAVESQQATDAVPLGLVAGLLWHENADPVTTGVGLGMLQARLGGAELPPAEARAWGRTVRSYVSAGLDADDAAAVSAVNRAETLLTELRASQLVPLSELLPAAFTHRLRVFAAAIHDALPDVPRAALLALEQAHLAVREHEAASRDTRAATATMALRLLRWLAVSPEPGSAKDTVATLADALDRQVRVDAWVDRAVADVWTGDSDPQVGAAYRSLAEQVLQRRARHDEQLATLLASVTAHDQDLGRIIPVEHVLARVVRPLAATRPVLLLVIDGMSTGVMTEVAESLRSRRWIELVAENIGQRQPVLAALPTVTGVSRTSLLTGTLTTGGQDQERQGFAAAVGYPAALYHKNDLRSPAGDVLSPDLRSALGDPQKRVVGVVLNTIDDALDKMDPGGTQWGAEAIQYLAPLIEAARQADRVVVLLSDHGHVVERGTEYRPAAGGGARWRPAATGAPGPGEIVLRGSRVQLGEGAIVVPWREDLRYTAKAAGYHGGVSAAEVTIPLTVHVAGAVGGLAGWAPGPPPEPRWWHSPLAPDRLTVIPQVPAAPPQAATARPTLFDEPLSAPSTTAQGTLGGTTEDDAVDGLIHALLASPVYAAQRARGGRGVPDDERVVAVLEHLLRADGRLHQTTLAAAVGLPAVRIPTTIAALRRLLAVDGYETLSVDPDGVTLVLNVPLLREQFGLGSAS